MKQSFSQSTQLKITDLKKKFENETDYYILHIDDENELRTLFCDMMNDFGIKTLSASSSIEALNLLREKSQKIVLIVSDIKMPNSDGFELRQDVLKLYPEIPFCIASGYVDRDMALKGVDLKIAAFLSKPYDFEKLTDFLVKEAIPRLKILKDNYELKLSFIADSESLIEESEEILLRLEQNAADTEALNRFYAIMHTLKGAWAFFEPKDLHRFTHLYEDILKKLQRSEISFTPHVYAVLFKGFDTIKELFSEFRSEKHKDRNFEDLLKVLDLGLNTQQNLIKKDSNTSESNNAHKEPSVTKQYGTEDIKVSVKLLDEFIQLSGEVTVIRNMLNKCVGSIERRYAGDRDVAMLTELLSELHKINSGVQNKMSEIRMVPLKSIVRVLPRAVRDVAKSLSKKVELQIEGEELRVDTSIAEVLNNSLLHIIKNSVDHGLETPEDRKTAGKPEVGKIVVNASTRDDKVIVRISDDGRGLNLEAIKSKLVKNGTHTKAQVDTMSTPDLYLMIFSSGFSTAQQVTEISGRGVGMSMVKDCVDAIGGRISIDSNYGKGATFLLELPVPKSVLIASCLGVQIGTRRFSLIQDDILRVLQFDINQTKNYIQELEKSKCLLFENELIPIADLNTLFKLNENITAQENRKLVVMRTGQDFRRIAIEVSSILDVEDMVIKNMHATLNSASLYRGVTFLDDGGVGLILNTNGIMDALHISRENSKNKSSQQNSKQHHSVDEIKIPQLHALTVLIKDAGVYALPQESVFRIEEFDSSLIKQSGSSQVIPYRGSVLKVARLADSITNLKDIPNSYSENEKRRLVVIENENRFFGFEVDEILDMVTYENLKTELAQDNLGIDGHFFLGDKTISLLNVDKIIKKAAIYLDSVANLDPASESKSHTHTSELLKAS